MNDPSFTCFQKDEVDTITDSKGNKYENKLISLDSTSQLVEKTMTEDSEEMNYVAYVVAEYETSLIESESSAQLQALGGGSTSDWNYDSATMNYKIYAKVSYSYNSFERSSVLYNLYQFTSISGKAERLDSGTSCTKLLIKESDLGDIYKDNKATTSRISTAFNSVGTVNSPTNNTYYSITNTTGSNGYWVNVASGGGTSVKAIVQATIKRTSTGSTWTTPEVVIKFTDM